MHIPYQQNWLTSPTTSIIAIAFVNAWQFMGYQFSLLYAGLNLFLSSTWKLPRLTVAPNGWRIVR